MEDEVQAIRRVLSGERECFRLLVERYQTAIVRFIRNLLYDSSDAEDLAQEVFLAAFHKLSSFDLSRGRFSTWLFTIARNRCLNQLRRHRPTSVPLDEASDLCAGEPRLPLDEGEQLGRQLDRAFAALPVDQRTAFLLAEVEGLAYPAIAEIEGVAVGTIKSRIHRARERLQTLLKHMQGDVS